MELPIKNFDKTQEYIVNGETLKLLKPVLSEFDKFILALNELGDKEKKDKLIKPKTPKMKKKPEDFYEQWDILKLDIKLQADSVFQIVKTLLIGDSNIIDNLHRYLTPSEGMEILYDFFSLFAASFALPVKLNTLLSTIQAEKANQ